MVKFNAMNIFSYAFLWRFFLNFIILSFTYMCTHYFGHSTHSQKEPVLVFWLVWDKDSYTERFLALLPCTCVLQPTLVHLYLTSSLLSGPLPIGASVSLRLLYLLLYSEHINHIQILGFLPFPYSSCVCSPLSVWPMFNNITAFVIGLWSAYEGEHAIFGLLSLANFT
jgi:hypothetical protein